jgi:ADP-ribosylglycohydrolase
MASSSWYQSGLLGALLGDMAGEHRPGVGREPPRPSDDSRLALAVARLLVEGRLREETVAASLLDWYRGLGADGRADLGPSTLRALARLEAGSSPAEAGKGGDTNGAAVRVIGIGLALPPEPGRLLPAVAAATRPTHNSEVARMGAAALAAAISVRVAGGDWAEVAAAAKRLARAAGEDADLLRRLDLAFALAEGEPEDEFLVTVRRRLGNGLPVREAVPAALALARRAEVGPEAVALALRLGGDEDTIAALAGAVAGAGHAASRWPAAWRHAVPGPLGAEIRRLARELKGIREREGS